MPNRPFRANEGMALLLTAFFVSIALLVMTALASRLVNANFQVAHFEDYENAFHAVESAISQSKADLVDGGNGVIGMNIRTEGTSRSPYGPLNLPSFDDSLVTPVQIPSMPDADFFAFALDWSSDGLDNNGDGLIDGTEEEGYYSVYGFGRVGEAVRRVEVVYEGQDVNVWNNAVFAGAGHVSGAVKGNCSIHGSVHILGDHVPEGGESIVVLDLMGTSLLHNNYDRGPGQGPSARMMASVPPLPKTLFNGEQIETLNGVLRVKRGLVSVNSAAEIGQPDVAGNSFKETMDATYNEEGWTGSRVSDDGGRGDPSVVYSDNGWDEGYDLGNAVSFPTLADDWRWPARVECFEMGYDVDYTPGGTEVSPNGDNYGHAEFFTDVLSDGAPYNGDVYMKIGGSNVYINLTRPGDSNPAHRVKPNPATCQKGDDYLYFNAATGLLEMNGQVEINGTLRIEGKGGKNPQNSLYYTGRAALLVHGDITIDSDLLPCNNGVIADYTRSFPEKNFLGVMGAQNMLIGAASQIQIMGGFYAQGIVTSNKQSVVMGTFVAEYFDMGQQVPDIYQVPALSKNLPLGMIGNWPLFALQQLSWRELES